ncbi:hypothetical protein J2Y48_005077 [Mycoplana sp. BE70]|uniref:hypothetical protein n=1 Tax=Mycoplana sp. BE70 TaxID=2817775 RepID=UPI00286569A5|nr:hypothetical protein [Mycoplana sp. BE70]MDR6759759.1 hypothetical protein [Mycoplana sp. BE70]
MIERTTETQITFEHPFVLGCLVAPLQAGTYRLVVDEELIEGLSFSAYRRVATHLEIPAISTVTATRQFLRVSAAEIESALLKDAGIPTGNPVL